MPPQPCLVLEHKCFRLQPRVKQLVLAHKQRHTSILLEKPRTYGDSEAADMRRLLIFSKALGTLPAGPVVAPARMQPLSRVFPAL